MNWGKVELLPTSTITVTGEAKQTERNQIASFSAGVTAQNDDKDTAVNEVNEKMTKLIADLKEFGINDSDLETQSISVNKDEMMELIYPPRTTSGQWRASNSVEIALRDVDRTDELADLLSASGATDVYGPNFRLDDTNTQQAELLADAINDAREKAEKIAEASDRKLGKVITVTEGSSPSIYPLMEARSADTSTPVEPGSSSIYQTATVTFELK
ncbi:MAG: hypothetical protein UV74_C0013G0041 [Candidatus Woesebacteria bacterium GW2011_GWB1_43_14]|uniref:Outer membrane protein n=1 Tax=Candidatus Woesebacteria bacterium GW2011_GWB1_43_14 TaxID=1618578 RepID=A0A0G1DGU7_9BACT|nr:MAG: hypothetical protein UV51_C0009G0044 [Candidatus Woesebacteria bacterium GW2011_GWC1_42_9]KKS96919.1 MAG: hypothetical protein UV74_C0013G0041 [Candidatus Woesebacteria bacterium GW2011_GWB1_43_14]